MQICLRSVFLFEQVMSKSKKKAQVEEKKIEDNSYKARGNKAFADKEYDKVCLIVSWHKIQCSH